MIKTPLSTMIGGAFWTPCATILGLSSQNLTQLIKSIFANNEQGFAYDPNDLTTLYQDAAGAIPVTGAGQPVGLIKDKSGRNNHAFQTVSASRPILQRNATTGAYYLAFDGTDDFLVTNNINFTATDKVSLFAGMRSLTANNLYPTIAMFTPAPNWFANNGAFVLAQSKNPASYNVGSRGSSQASTTSNTVYTTPTSNVLSAKLQISSDLLVLRVDGKLSASSASDQGVGNYGNYPLYIGRDFATGNYAFSGHLYSLIGIGRLTTDSETITLEKAIAKNTGVTLSV